MKKDIILSGVGGQGILSIAAVIGEAALQQGLYMKQSEVHGMSQRGGDVQSNLRISDSPIASDLIPKGNADLILSMEPMEALRYLPYMNENGWIVSSSTCFKNIPVYPADEQIIDEIKKCPNHVLVDAEEIAKQCGNTRGANIVLVGAALPFLDMPVETVENAIRYIFSRKGEQVVEANLAAMRAGYDHSMKHKQ